MDIVNIILFCFMSCIVGAVVLLLVQYYVFIRYLDPSQEQDDQQSGVDGQRQQRHQQQQQQPFELPDELLFNLKTQSTESKSPVSAINLVLQFLFFELRYRTDVRKWFYRKLSLELDELLTKTTTGKLFDKLSIRNLDLGGQFPDIKNVRVHNVELHETEGHIENLDLILNLQYQGNFKISIEADMVLGKKAFLSIIVKHISGLVRLQFTRKPYTHYGLSFVGDPQIDLGIESQFQGRQMQQTQVTTVISNQIKKAIRRKHTLPNYKLRYKPFFHRIEDEDASDVIPDGCLEVHLLQASRLMLAEHQNVTHVYCSVTVANVPWITAKNESANNGNTLTISLMIEIHKTKYQQIGIVFKQLEGTVIIEAILPNSPAAKSDLRKNDILYTIEGKQVTHINQVAKIVKGINKPMFMLRIDRTIAGHIKADQMGSVVAAPVAVTKTAAATGAASPDREHQLESIDRISFSKVNDSVQLLSGSDRANSSDSSHTTTPSSSPRKVGLLSRAGKTKSLSRNESETEGSSMSITGRESMENISRPNEGVEPEVFVQHTSKTFPFNPLIHLEDFSQFTLAEGTKYLNLNVFGSSSSSSTNDGGNAFLLAYCNIPIGNILSECSESNLRNFLKRIQLNPPDSPNLTNSSLSPLSGFDASLCYGDLLISFVWSGSNMGLFYADSVAGSGKRSTKAKAVAEPPQQPTKQHDFMRKHFNRTTQCDFCGKKIWLKDAVQCKDCAMCCHKKCITKCQNATVCGSSEQIASGTYNSNPEFKVTEPIARDTVDKTEPPPAEAKPAPDGHRASLGDFLAQGLKRVNSANNLAIPGIVSQIGQVATKSLPPSPQLTPRKQSLSKPANNPFMVVAQRLESLMDETSQIQERDIVYITEPLIGWGSADEMMSLAKSASHHLYADMEPLDRVERITNLLTKLRLALDFETSNHADLTVRSNELRQMRSSPASVDALRLSSDSLLLQTKPAAGPVEPPKDVELDAKMTKCAFNLGQSEERVQALSVLMLHLCSGLQHAQGIANQ